MRSGALFGVTTGNTNNAPEQSLVFGGTDAGSDHRLQRVAIAYFVRDAVDLFGQTHLFQSPDQIAREIELPPVQTVKGRTGEGVMIIGPALTKGQHTDDPFVMAAVIGLKLAFAKGMADRIDAPGDVVVEEHAH